MAEAISDGASELEKRNALTGMDFSPEEISGEPAEVTPAPKPEPKPEVKAEEAKSEDEDDEDGEDDDEGESKKDKPLRSAKNERPIKSAFKQIKELRGTQKEIKDGIATIMSRLDTLTPKQQEQVVDELQAVADKRGLDPEGLSDILELAEKRMMARLEKEGKLNKGIDPETQELLNKVSEEHKEREQEAIFTGEWNLIVPELQKQFPNAKANELIEARDLMYELARSEQGVILNKKGEVVANRDLDYLLFKNRSKFETILKVAKNAKSGETSSKQITEDTGDGDIDLDPETMDPDKMKAYNKRKYGN